MAALFHKINGYEWMWNYTNATWVGTVGWRDKDHPQLAVLPPLQIEMNED